jgi:pimeloyl-ACP methyl ester carboxylesterase/mannose-6-phosphate isomerase-like protein (cupin superfamily)
MNTATRHGKATFGQLSYFDVGHGTPLVLLHGIGSSAASFAPQIDTLASSFRVLAPDALGYGDSADPATAPGIDGYATSIGALLTELGIGPAVILGLSWGAVIATRLALLAPQQVSALILADSSVGSGADATRSQAMLERPRELSLLGSEAFAHKRFARLLSPNAPEALRAKVQQNMAASIRMPGYEFAAQAMASTDHRSRLGEIAVPTLVMVGEFDVVCPESDSQLLVQGIPGAEFAIVPGAGHLSNQENPLAFNALVTEFFVRHRQALQQSAEKPSTQSTSPGVTMSDTNLETFIDSCMATRDSRLEDWNALGFQAAAGDQFKRAQIRYVGSGGTGNHENDTRILAAEHFTFSNMLLPPGAEGPEHTHHDVEEVFFVLEGVLDVSIHDLEDGTKMSTRRLGYRDLIKVPAGVPRSLRNVGDTDALFCVMVGTAKPEIPTYPPTSAVFGLKR